MTRMIWTKGAPLLNKELITLADGDVIWLQHHRDGRVRRSEPLRVRREPDGSFSLFDPENAISGLGEFFVNNLFPDDPEQQVGRDVHDGILIFRANIREK